MKKILFYLQSLLGVKANNDRLTKLEEEVKRLTNNEKYYEQELNRFGSLLTADVDVSFNKYDSTTVIVRWCNPKNNNWEIKVFELERDNQIERMFKFLHDLRIPGRNVFFDAGPGYSQRMKEDYTYGRYRK